MNKKEKILNDLTIDKKFTEDLINHYKARIEEYERALQIHRNELTEINDLIRKLLK